MPSNTFNNSHKPKFCVYLTIYSGTKLPPLYIGSSSVSRVRNGYHGSVTSKIYKTTWKEELKENPHLFKTVILKTYYSRLNCVFREYLLQKEHNVVSSHLFINMGFANKKFNNPYPRSQTTKDKISASKKHTFAAKWAETNEPFGQVHVTDPRVLSGELVSINRGRSPVKPRSKETREKLSKIHKGKSVSIQTRIKISENHADVSGDKNPAAIKVSIFNQNQELMFSCFGNFKNVCEENGLPFSMLQKSYLNNGAPIFQKKRPHTLSFLPFVGWFAIKHSFPTS